MPARVELAEVLGADPVAHRNRPTAIRTLIPHQPSRRLDEHAPMIVAGEGQLVQFALAAQNDFSQSTQLHVEPFAARIQAMRERSMKIKNQINCGRERSQVTGFPKNLKIDKLDGNFLDAESNWLHRSLNLRKASGLNTIQHPDIFPKAEKRV